MGILQGSVIMLCLEQYSSRASNKRRWKKTIRPKSIAQHKRRNAARRISCWRQ